MDGLDREVTQMLGQPGSPAGADPVSGLQVTPLLGRAAALHQTGVPAMGAGQKGRHHGRFTVRPGRQYDRLVSPFHRNVLSKFSVGCRIDHDESANLMFPVGKPKSPQAVTFHGTDFSAPLLTNQ
jgi:hypothetical protein